ncbi:MAG: PaaI family thioesterase [Candidatus Hydrogenedentes bacterium]|nr:PaaI family thioesterase [Candidatus Hydrogenedentota bacterium]MBI3117222.1 PaaI family thioesterase [Candidatus Hydrogenedentota bacterium]
MTPDRVYLPNSEACFVCGEENRAGLQVRFYVEDDVVKMPLTVREHHCGYKNVVHGGVVAAALDETMGWAAARSIKRMCITGELTVRYLQPVPADRELTVCGRTVRAHRRMVQTEGHIEDSQGAILARAEGRFLPLSVEETLQVDDALLYRGDEERVFDELRGTA